MSALGNSRPLVKFAQDIILTLNALHVPMEKTAGYTKYRMSKDAVDSSILGKEFVKMAHAMGKDPWALAWDVASNFDSVVLNKEASLTRVRDFYTRWLSGMEKKASADVSSQHNGRMLGK